MGSGPIRSDRLIASRGLRRTVAAATASFAAVPLIAASAANAGDHTNAANRGTVTIFRRVMTNPTSMVSGPDGNLVRPGCTIATSGL